MIDLYYQKQCACSIYNKVEQLKYTYTAEKCIIILE